MSADYDLLIVGAGPAGLAAALAAAPSGARIALVDDNPAAGGQIWRDGPRASLPPRAHQMRQRLAGHANVEHFPATRVVACGPGRRLLLAALGEERLEAVRLREGGRVREIACERLACGFGLAPNVQLGQALGYRLDGQALAVDEWQAGSLPDHYAAGECTGFGGSELALVEGAIAGHAAVDERDAARRLWPRRRRWQGFADTLARHFALRAELRELAEADTLVCRCEDVPLAALAGHAGWTEAKLHSRCGMGACQGRICGSAAQFLFGWTPPAPRPPFSPARLETLARWQGDAG